MALLDTEGFGLSTNIADYVNYGGCTNESACSIATGGPLGDNYLAVGQNAYFVHTLPKAAAVFFTGQRFYVNTSLGENQPGVNYQDSSGNTQLTVSISAATGIVTVWAGGVGGTVLGQSAAPVALNSWIYLEVGAVIGSGTTGSVAVKVNGALVLAVAGANTNPTSAGSVGRVIWTTNDNRGYLGPYVTHFYFCDNTGPAPWNTYLGDVRVQSLYATSTDATQFTPPTGMTNVAVVDQMPPNTADYNADGNTGDQDTFNLGPLATNALSVLGVSVRVLAAKSDAGVRFAATVLKSGTTTAVGTSTALSTSFQQLSTIYELDPATGVQWTTAGVDALKAGYKVTG